MPNTGFRQKTHGDSAEQNNQVIEYFCTGLLNGQLAAKMLRKSDGFDNIKAAIDFATEREAVSNLRTFIGQQHDAASAFGNAKY